MKTLKELIETSTAEKLRAVCTDPNGGGAEIAKAIARAVTLEKFRNLMCTRRNAIAANGADWEKKQLGFDFESAIGNFVLGENTAPLLAVADDAEREIPETVAWLKAGLSSE